MQTTRKRIDGLRLPAGALLGYGAVGVAAQLRVPALLGAALGVLGGHGAAVTPGDPPGIAPLTAFFAAQPWLPWAAWLLGLALLAGRGRPMDRAPAAPVPTAGGRVADLSPPPSPTKGGESAPTSPPSPTAGGESAPSRSPSLRRGGVGGVRSVVTLVTLGVLLALGAWARLNVLLPQARGLTQFPYDDEGVYAGAGQMALQGIWPYRDFFFAHPPLAALVYTPALAYHFTPWGSPTSFMLARYLSVAYSLAALAGLFALGRLLGRVGDPTPRPPPLNGEGEQPSSSPPPSGEGLGEGAVWSPQSAWIGPLLGGATAAGLWALDGRAVEINRKIMLDQPMILAAVLAVLAYFWAWRGAAAPTPHPSPEGGGELDDVVSPSRFRSGGWGVRSVVGPDRRWLALAGVLAAVSLLIKIQGMACLVALGLDLLWRLRGRGRAARAGQAQFGDILALAGGALTAALVVVGPALIVAPSPFIRMVGFFQLLRPSDGVVAPADRIANLTAVVAPGPHLLLNGPTMYLAALGFLALTAWAVGGATRSRHPPLLKREGALMSSNSPPPLGEGLGVGAAESAAAARARWRLIVIWSFLSVLLFTYSRSFYNHYYVQLVTPLCLLAGAVWLPLAAGGVHLSRTRRLLRSGWAVALLPALALLLPAWQGLSTRYDDPIFAIVGRFANDAVPPGAPVLASDEQFNFLAARPPSHTAGGYLIDSYGHMIALGLDLPNRSWGDLLDAALHGQHSDDAYAVMRRPAPQADFLARARQAALVIVHDRGKARLLPATYTATLALGPIRDTQPRYVIIAPDKGP